MGLGVVLALLIGAVGAAVGPAAGAQEAGTASVTVHSRNCPTAYAGTSYYEDCHATPLTGIEYTVEGPETAARVTGADGNVVFAGLVPGTYVVEEYAIPFDFIDRLVVFCAPAAAPGTAFPFVATGRGARLDLAPGDDVVCDFYYVGTDARGELPVALTIHNRLCPEGFSGPDYYGACHHTPAPAGLDFVALPVATDDAVEATTDAAGNVAFDLMPGEYTVRGGVPGEFATLTVFCAAASAPGTEFPVTPVGGGTRGPGDLTGIRIVLGAGEAVVCDWYNTPEGQRGEVTPTPAPAPTTAPVAPPPSRGRTTPITLPNTGAGTIDGGLGAPVAGALALLVVGLAATGVAAAGRRPG